MKKIFFVLTGLLFSIVLQAQNVGIGTTIPGAKLEVNGFTKLGSTAPAVQMKKLTGTTPAAASSGVSIAHGLTASKIIAVNLIINNAGSQRIPGGYTLFPGNEVNWDYGTTFINIWTNTNSANILSKPFTVLLTYEEAVIP